MATNINVIPPAHVLDETGKLAENLVTNESRVLGNYPVRALAPLRGSFYTESFKLRDSRGVVVARNKYQFALFSEALAGKTGKEVAGACVITDATVSAPVYYDYQAVGGPWGASNEMIIKMFEKMQSDDRPVSWPNILGKPDEYKGAHHLQDIGDLYGAEYWVAAMERLTHAILMGDNASHDEIWRKIDEMREEITAQIASQNDSLKRYVDQQDDLIRQSVTALNTRVTQINDALNLSISNVDSRVTQVNTTLTAAINATNNALNLHVNDTNNPHRTNASQVGTYDKAYIDNISNSLNTILSQNFVKKNVAEELALRVSGGQLQSFVNGVWRVIYPSQWA